MPAVFARSCEIKMDALDGAQWPVSERSVKKKQQKKSNDQRAPVTRYYLITEPVH